MVAKKKVRRKHIPLRTCIACRQKKDKRQLTRLVRTVDDGVVVDLTGKRNGRGAYLCDDSACWDRALNTHLLERALAVEISEDEKKALAKFKPAPAPTT